MPSSMHLLTPFRAQALRTARHCLPALALACLAQAPAQAAEFVTSLDSQCAVWGPWSLGDDKQPVRYQGPCVKGKADGKGKAVWLNPYRFKEGKEEADQTWEGQFRSGVFIGDQTFKGGVDAWRGNLVLSDRGKVGDTIALWVHQAPSKGPVDLCEIEHVALVVPNGFKTEDDALVHKLMLSAQQAYVTACPSNKPFRSTEVVLWNAVLIPDPKGAPPPALAKASVVLDNGKPAEVRVYRNDASAAVRQKQADAERNAKRAQARQAFHKLSADQQVQAWLTTAQAEKDPFKWQGKTVALTVKLERMLSPTVAWVTDADRGGYYGYGGYTPMLLKGVSSDTFGKLDTAVVIGQIDGRKRAADLGVSGSSDGIEATTLNVTHTRPCEQRQCMDWLGWDVRKEMTWGEPFKAAP